jgi:hypothetical protein
MSDAPDTFGGARLIFAHKHPTSARLRFVRFEHGMCGFIPFPAEASLCPDEEVPESPVVTLPSVHLAEAERRLGLPSGGLKIEPEFRQCVDVGDACVEVHLAMFTAMDPPFETIAGAGGRFVAITEARGCAQIELELLRKAYEAVLGG